MSNRLSRARKGDKRPAVRQDEFANSIRSMNDKLQQMHYMSLYQMRNMETRFNFFVEYLTKKGIIEEQDYKDYLEDVDKKMKLAGEISKDESLSEEQRIAKAKENDIPEEWVIEQKEVSPQEEQGSAAGEAEQEPESLIVTP